MSNERVAYLKAQWSDERRAYYIDHGGFRWYTECRPNENGETDLSADQMFAIFQAIVRGKLTAEVHP